MKALINYFKKKEQPIRFQLHCEIEYIKAETAVELCEKINRDQEGKGVNATTIVAAIICLT